METLTDLRKKLFTAKKIQLHSGIEGFVSPNVYGIYKTTGGAPIGTVGQVFEPCDLNLFLDIIESSIESSNADLDISKLKFVEYGGGQKVSFELPLGKREIKTPMVGDVIENKLQFVTGFDGKTSQQLAFFCNRLWCTNGAARWEKAIGLTQKNTFKNSIKSAALFSDAIWKILGETEKYAKQLEWLATQEVTNEDVNRIIKKVTGYDYSEYAEMKTKSRNILDRINESVAIEMQNTGANKFSLLQGFTRYATHEVAKGSEEKLMFHSAAALNTKAHAAILN